MSLSWQWWQAQQYIKFSVSFQLLSLESVLRRIASDGDPTQVPCLDCVGLICRHDYLWKTDIFWRRFEFGFHFVQTFKDRPQKMSVFHKKKILNRYIRLPAGILWSLPSKSSIPLHLQSRLTYHCRLELIRSHVLAGKRIYLQERILRFESKEPSVSKETVGFPKKTVGSRDWAEKASTTGI